jgi:hypothetical protein
MLYGQHAGDEEKIISAYASAEMRGEVVRQNNAHGLSPIQYARALYKDGLRKGWINA